MSALHDLEARFNRLCDLLFHRPSRQAGMMLAMPDWPLMP